MKTLTNISLIGSRIGCRRPGDEVGGAEIKRVRALAAYRADGMDMAELGVDTANQSGAHRLYEGLGYAVFHSSTMYSIEL